jgi:hypothetical protein
VPSHSSLLPLTFLNRLVARQWSLSFYKCIFRSRIVIYVKGMRFHATFLVFYNSHHIATSFNKPHMPTHRQQRNQNYPSSGEEFSDVGPTSDSDDESVAQTQDNWMFPVVSSKAKREEYETASKFHCKILLTNRSEVVFRLLKARKSRLANFKIKSKSFHSKILNYMQISKGKTILEVPAVFHQTMTGSSRSMPKSLES